jgi:hypothetical protein
MKPHRYPTEKIQDEIVLEIRDALETSGVTDHHLRQGKTQNSAWMRDVLGHLRSQFNAELDRQWDMLRLFVPLSLAPFAAVVSTTDLGRREVSILAFASISLLTVGNVFSELLRDDSVKYRVWIETIEAEMGLPSVAAMPWKRRSISIDQARWILLLLVVAGWAAAVFTA